MAAGDSLIKKRKRLRDLYAKGVEVRLGGRYGPEGAIARLESTEDDENTPEHLRSASGHFLADLDESDESAEISMWVQPPSPLNREEALRNANAARARAVLVAKQDETSEEYLAAMEFIADMSEDTLYDYVLLIDADERRQDALREVLSGEEWSNINELQESLRVFEEEDYPDDHPEVLAVNERELELNRQVNERELELREAALQVLKLGGPDRARKQALKKRSEIQGTQAFMREYERHMQYFAVRESREHNATYFFEGPKQLADEPEEVRDLIMMALSKFITDGAEAKN